MYVEQMLLCPLSFNSSLVFLFFFYDEAAESKSR